MEEFIKFITAAEQSVILQNLRTLLEKREITSQHIEFLRQALQNKVIPKAFRMKLPKHFEAERNKLENKLIRNRIRQHHRTRNTQDMKLKFIHRVLAQRLHYIEHEEYLKLFNQQVYFNTCKQKQTRYNKLRSLVREKNLNNKDVRGTVSCQLRNILNNSKSKDCLLVSNTHSTTEFPDRFTNLSKINLQNKHLELLELGHKYCPSPHKIDVTTLAIDLENQLTTLNKFNNLIKGELTQQLKHIQHNNNDNSPSSNTAHYNSSLTDKLKNLNKFIKDNNLIVTSGDKNAGLVILDREEYIAKTEKFFTNNNIAKISSNPIKKYASKVNKCLNTHSDTLNKMGISAYRAKVMNPYNPQLKSLIKLHKADKSIRPIITNFNTPASKIAKSIQSFITRDLQFEAKYAIKNSRELTDAIKNYKPNKKTTILSFDITNLYNNINVEDSLKIVRKFLDDKLIPTSDFDVIDTESIMEILEIITEQNFFTFNNQFYRMTNGVQMGSPISGLIAEMFLNKLEAELFSEKYKMFTKNIKHYFRYVDDIFIIHEGSKANITAIHNILNNISNLQFTIETEKDNRLNFLDITITKNNKKNILEFQIYRKPTATDIIIPYNSSSPYEHKKAAFLHLFHRALDIPMSHKELHKEINTIIQIGTNNGYNKDFMMGILNKIKHKNLLNKIYPNVRNKQFYVSIPYNKTYARMIKPILQKHDLQLSFKPGNNILNILTNNKSKIPDLEKSGVYKLSCNNCPKFYIGQSGRSLKERFKEHANTNRSKMSNHLTETGHKINQNSMILIHNANKSRRLNLLEEMEIMRYLKTDGDNVLNELTYLAGSHLFTELL